MKHYLKLLHMEIHRFRYALAAIMALAIVIQIWTLVAYVNEQKATRQYHITESEANNVDIIDQYVYGSDTPYALRQVSFADAIEYNQGSYIISVMIGIAVIGLYVFLIWYRDWIGRSTFIYRLLALQAPRGAIYAAKLSAILLFVFAVIAFQATLLAIEQGLFRMLVPDELYKSSYFLDAVQSNYAFKILLPRSYDQFAFAYGMGIVAVVAIFTAIVIERSYRLVGIAYAIAFLVLCAAMLVYPMYQLKTNDGRGFFYNEEIFAMEVVSCVVVLAVSVWLGLRLLGKKISV
ncbi:hypothetical protein ACFPPD_20550 [Cohnella suwonensis]|uniref:ABC transporter permease n=1 Tax=Cohnella suwonensis TaxID=696072 RepID=A0ABW0LZ36_9BACL